MYAYDALNQLIRENNPDTGKTYVYTYDNAGNILTKKTYNLTAASSTPSSLISSYNYGYTDLCKNYFKKSDLGWYWLVK